MRKQAEEANELLAGEMSHRVKNLLTIATGLTAITSRSAATAQEMAHDLTDRLIALGRAHDLVRPVHGQSERVALLGDLLSIVLAPYSDLGRRHRRVRVTVPRMSVGEASATTLALALHELATFVTLFQEGDRLMAWFVGPIRTNGTGLSLPYLPRSTTTGVATAIVAAMRHALVASRNLCIVDPDDLWAKI